MYVGVQKKGVPLVIIPFHGIFHVINHPASWGYPHFPSWKPPKNFGDFDVRQVPQPAQEVERPSLDVEAVPPVPAWVSTPSCMVCVMEKPKNGG